MAAKAKRKPAKRKVGNVSTQRGNMQTVVYRNPPATIGAVRKKRRIGATHSGGGMKGIMHNILAMAENTAGMVIGAQITSRLPVTPAIRPVIGVVIGIAGMHFDKKPDGFIRNISMGIGSGSMMEIAHQKGVLRGVDDFVSGIAGMNEDTHLLPGNYNPMTIMGTDDNDMQPPQTIIPMQQAAHGGSPYEFISTMNYL